VIWVPKRVAEEAGFREKAAVEVEVQKGTLAGCPAASVESV
jgi:antitoxin component of MazEF toxin-antitoxin module